MTTETKDSYKFKTEVKQLLNILVHSLYKDRDIFLRELISNASDALTRMHFEMLTNRDVLNPDMELAVHIEIPEVKEGEPKRIVVKDSGIGMTKDELVTNLGTIAQSGAREFLSHMEDHDQFDPGEVIGQFGVGFYSVFMIADEVRVVSRSYKKRAKAAVWQSDGSESFQIETSEKEDRGTEIHIILKKDAEEFANEWKIKQIIKKHSDFVRYPVYVGDEQANRQESLWRKSSSEVKSEEYKQFYQQMTMDFEEPVVTIHFASDAPVHLRALLFVPAKRELGVLAARKEPGMMLYSHNVLIQEYCTDLLPNWLSFIDGVVDSEDLSLNVSRETVQNNRIMAQLAKTVKGRVLRELKKLAKNDPEKFEMFWNEFGRFFKEGLVTDFEAKEDVVPLLRYRSSKSEDKFISLDEYVERMPENQEEIYYVLGDSEKSVANSPHLDPFKARELEVLYWTDPIDPFVSPMLSEYKDKKLRNVDDSGLELPGEAEETPGEEAGSSLLEADFNRVIGRFVTTLGDRIIEVRASKLLKTSPIRLVSPEGEANRDMQRIQRYLDQNFEVPKKDVEVNRSHPLITNLARLIKDKPDDKRINLTIEQLYDSALVQEGLHPNPTEMVPRIQQLLELATAA